MLSQESATRPEEDNCTVPPRGLTSRFPPVGGSVPKPGTHHQCDIQEAAGFTVSWLSCVVVVVVFHKGYVFSDPR